MKMVCPYCENMQYALEGANFCSHRQMNALNLNSNAFYFSSSDLSSGKHTSRFSIRSVSKGYQVYEVNGKTQILHSENFLVFPEGQSFNNYISPSGWTEGLIIGISPEMLKDFLRNVRYNNESLLNQFDITDDLEISFYNYTYLTSPVLQAYFDQLTQDIQEGYQDRIYYEEFFYKILMELVRLNQNLEYKVDALSAIKSSTKKELFNRVNIAREYIDGHLDKDLSLRRISKVAYLSPFHFLRCFTAIFGVSPYQYILSQRVKKAAYLLNHFSLSAEEVMGRVGFENKRTFQRAFSKIYGVSPTTIIKSKETLH